MKIEFQGKEVQIKMSIKEYADVAATMGTVKGALDILPHLDGRLDDRQIEVLEHLGEEHGKLMTALSGNDEPIDEQMAKARSL